MSEFDFIRRYFAPLAHKPESLNLQDDAARVQVPENMDMIISTDSMVAGTHFPCNMAANVIAQRVVGAAVSDLAACGARPFGCLLTVGKTAQWDALWFADFTDGLGRMLTHYDMPLWGGDMVTVKDEGFLSLCVHGLVPTGNMLTRSGAQPGDIVYVSGEIGAGYLGVQAVLEDKQTRFRQAYENPPACIELGVRLRMIATAVIDVSDGLAADLDQICKASKCAMDIRFEAIPFAEKTARDEQISGGDDYQLAFCVADKKQDMVEQIAQDLAIPLTPIGIVKTPIGIVKESADDHSYFAHIYDKHGDLIHLKRRGYQHF